MVQIANGVHAADRSVDLSVSNWSQASDEPSSRNASTDPPVGPGILARSRMAAPLCPIPLFVEEMTKAAVEAGSEEAGERAASEAFVWRSSSASLMRWTPSREKQAPDSVLANPL
jgi:hypothetical protein